MSISSHGAHLTIMPALESGYFTIACACGATAELVAGERVRLVEFFGAHGFAPMPEARCYVGSARAPTPIEPPRPIRRRRRT